MKNDPIAVIDSGMGGVSVLRKLHKLMPNENYIYFGDSANAPYGIKTMEEIRELTVAAAEKMIKRGVKALVIACNTATSAAADFLRAKYPELIIIGLEPAIKPAALFKEDPRVLVLATPLTLKGEKFDNLMARFEDKAVFYKLPAPELVRFIENGDFDTPEEIAYLQSILSPYKDRVDAVVLGCTHFPFAKKSIRKILGDDVEFFNGGEGAARYCKKLLEEKDLLTDRETSGDILFENSDESKIELSRMLFSYKGD